LERALFEAPARVNDIVSYLGLQHQNICGDAEAMDDRTLLIATASE
jgi:hypothetical protein